MNIVITFLRRAASVGWLALCSLAALPALAATNYTFPGALPAGCSGSGPSYTCGALALGFQDTITIASPTPATITIGGAFSANQGQINASGAAANLNIVVNGQFTPGYLTRVNANVSATSINDSNGPVTWGGSISTTTGAIALGYQSTVAGNVSSTSGAITLAGSSRVNGNITCTSCTVTVGNAARVDGNVSGRSVNDTNGAVTFGGSVAATTGALTIGYGSTVAGNATSTSGAINLGGTSRVAQCTQSTSSAAITLGYGAVATGGVCCGASSSCSTSCVANNTGGAMPATCTPPYNPATAKRFDAFETSTATGSLTGVIKTKVAGTAFTVAVAAIDTTGSALATAFAGTVKVEVLDASNSTGALDTTTGCRSSWTVATGTSSSNLTFAASDQGRKTTANLSVANAFKDTRLRISYPATGTATAVGCSSDNFAIRPDRFDLINSSTPYGADVDAQSTNAAASTYRTLGNVYPTGGNVHKAGTPFTLRARAVNSSSVTTANYTGTPQASAVDCTPTTCPSIATVRLGTLAVSSPTTTSGVYKATATYDEAGAFGLVLKDDTFAAVDAADGSTDTERFITSAAGSIGRFVPYDFALTVLGIPPEFWTFTDSSICPPLVLRTFTYLGQPLKYKTVPQATITARNSAGGVTKNYPDAKLLALKIAVPQYGVSTAASGVTPKIVSSNKPPTIITANGDGTAVLKHDNTDTVTIDRATTLPLPAPPFDADITLAWSVSDISEGTTGPNLISSAAFSFPAIAFDATKTFRFGIASLNSGNGSELVRLALPLEVQYVNPQGAFARNTEDNCTQIPASALAMSNFRSNLAACETAPSPSTPVMTMVNGRALLVLQAPGNGNSGSVDLALNLGATATGQQCASVGAAATAATAANTPWLQRLAPAGTYTANPTSRASFGQYRSPVIHMREVF